MTQSTRSRPPARGNGSPPRVGCEVPRIWTPPLRRLTRNSSLGFEAIEFAEKILGIDLWPWQRWLLIHALEVLPDGTFRFRKVILLVARQNGKSLILQVLTLWRMYLDDCRLTIGTAQNLDVAEEVWQGAVELAEDIPVLAKRIAEQGGVVRVNGKKTLKLQTGERYKVAAASRRGGRGFAGAELILLDELREHQSWDSWAAVTKTTQTKERAQIWGVSNAGDASSIVLRYLRQMAHESIGNPDGLDLVEPDDDLEDDLADADGIAVFEWSAAPGCAISDRDGWAQANPSLGHMISERVIAGDARTDPEWVFRTEVLCQWSDGSIEGPFPPESWEACCDPGSEIVGPYVFAVDVSWDRSTAHIAVAGRRADGLTHIEVVASRAGTDWLAPWLNDRTDDDVLGVTWQHKGAPVSSLTEEDVGLTFIPWKELGPACGAFYDLVRVVQEHPAQGLRHLPQPLLDVAAATAATRPLGDSWVWDRKHSPTDIAPLVACTAAVWALGEPPPPPPRKALVMTIGGTE